jgi:hypothetical protein
MIFKSEAVCTTCWNKSTICTTSNKAYCRRVWSLCLQAGDLEIKAIISIYQCLSTTTSPFITARAILEDLTKVLFQASTTNLQTKSQPMSLFLYLTLGQLHGSNYLSVRCFCSNIHSPLLLLMLNSESLGSLTHPVKGMRLPEGRTIWEWTEYLAIPRRTCHGPWLTIAKGRR